MRVLVAVHDLMFTSKINAAGRGHELVWLPRGTAIADKVREVKPDVLVVDLGNASLKAPEAIRAVKADAATKGVHVIGYTGHTEESIIQAAHDAGADQVMSKGEFTRRLPELFTATAR
jgi:DNA-binding NarL/FixJ family response regulator